MQEILNCKTQKRIRRFFLVYPIPISLRIICAVPYPIPEKNINPSVTVIFSFFFQKRIKPIRSTIIKQTHRIISVIITIFLPFLNYVYWNHQNICFINFSSSHRIICLYFKLIVFIIVFCNFFIMGGIY